MNPDDLRQRRHLLFTMLTACAWRDSPAGAKPIVAGLRQFFGGWLGIGRVTVGMARQGYDLQLTGCGEDGWRTTFYPAGRAHSVTSAVGSACTATLEPQSGRKPYVRRFLAR
jgi:hypothetical protein